MKTHHRLPLWYAITVLLLLGGTVAWLNVQWQYALNRQLITALVQNDTEKSLALVEAGADPNTRLKPSPAPSLKQLLQRCLRPKPFPANDSPTAFMLACGMLWTLSEDGSTQWVEVPHNLPLVRAMILYGADVNAKTANAQTVLMGAVSNGHVDIVELLLQQGAKVNTPNNTGTTVLMYAQCRSDEAEVRVLLAHGAAVNAQDEGGYTALHYAVNGANINVLRQLLAHGANPNLAAKDGKTPLLLAQQMKRPDIVALMRHGEK
jgi:hypothetical protein